MRPSGEPRAVVTRLVLRAAPDSASRSRGQAVRLTAARNERIWCVYAALGGAPPDRYGEWLSKNLGALGHLNSLVNTSLIMLLGLGHVDVACRDLERSLFYAHIFGPLGLSEPFPVEGERGEQIHYLRFPTAGSGSLGLRQALEEQEFELYAPGLHHIAFAVESHADVDEVYARLCETPAEVLHPPQFWPQYHPKYYATFFLDPDGFRLEVAGSRDARL